MPEIYHIKVYLIDDDKVTLFLSEKLIKTRYPGFTVVSFMSGLEAIRFFSEYTPAPGEIILLDINMPDYTGWDFLNDFSKLGSGIPVFMYTSSIDARDVDQSRHFDAVKGFITKPLLPEKLEQAFSILNIN